MVVLTEKFRFIRDDVFLCPWVDTETGKQILFMQKINLETNEIEFEDSIDCIHAAITDLSFDEFNELQNDSEIQEKLLKKTLFIRSSENLEEIDLTPEEKFKALKSWAAGIADLGINALQVQSEIENAADLAYPMIGKLFRFITKADSKFIYRYLSKIERECKFEGTNHKSSLIANLLPILLSISEPDDMMPEFKNLKQKEREIMSAILSREPPHELFEKNSQFIYLLKDFPDYLNKLNLLDTMDSTLYLEIKEINPSLPKKLLNEASKRCTKNDILNEDCFYRTLEKIMYGISLNYKEVFDYHYIYELHVDKHEIQIIYLYLIHRFYDSSLLKFSSLFKFILKYLLEKINENNDLIVLLLVSESLDLFNKIPKHFLKKAFHLELANLYFSKIFKIFGHDEEILIKKCAQFLNLLIFNFKNEEDRQFYQSNDIDQNYIYDNKQDVYYYDNYREIINSLFEFRPPPKLFIQNRLFLKFLKLPEALKIQEYKNFIDNLDSETIPKFMEMDEIEKYKWEIKKAEQLGDLSKKASSFTNIGYVYMERNEFDKAIEPLNKSLKIENQLGNLPKKAKLLGVIGAAYFMDGGYNIALENYNKALKIEKDLGNISEQVKHLNNIGMTYSRIGDRYSMMKKYKKAIENYSNALKIEEQLGNLSNKTKLLNLIASSYSMNGEYNIALETYKEALKIDNEQDNINGKVTLLDNMGMTYIRIGEDDLALETFNEGIKLADQLGDFTVKEMFLEKIEYYISRNKFEK